MKLTATELKQAKRAARRLFCLGDGQHELRKTLIDGKTLGWRCHKCGFETIPKKIEP